MREREDRIGPDDLSNNARLARGEAEPSRGGEPAFLERWRLTLNETPPSSPAWLSVAPEERSALLAFIARPTPAASVPSEPTLHERVVEAQAALLKADNEIITELEAERDRLNAQLVEVADKLREERARVERAIEDVREFKLLAEAASDVGNLAEKSISSARASAFGQALHTLESIQPIPPQGASSKSDEASRCSTCGGTKRCKNALDFTVDCPACTGKNQKTTTGPAGSADDATREGALNGPGSTGPQHSNSAQPAEAGHPIEKKPEPDAAQGKRLYDIDKLLNHERYDYAGRAREPLKLLVEYLREERLLLHPTQPPEQSPEPRAAKKPDEQR